MERIETAEEWVGRLYLESQYKERNSYPKGKTLAYDLEVSELLPERLTIGDFPGFKSVNLTKANLDIVVRQELTSWRAALSTSKAFT